LFGQKNRLDFAAAAPLKNMGVLFTAVYFSGLKIRGIQALCSYEYSPLHV